MWDDQPNPFTASRGRVTEDMLGAIVAQVVYLPPFVAPGAYVDAVVVQEACGLDIAFVGPSRGTVQERIDSKRAGQAEN